LLNFSHQAAAAADGEGGSQRGGGGGVLGGSGGGSSGGGGGSSSGGGGGGGHTVVDPDALLAAGTHVRMQHLTSHASLNNRRGVVRRYDVELRRFVVTVRVGDAEVEHAVRAENLVAR
jgi:hypothetical protein